MHTPGTKRLSAVLATGVASVKTRRVAVGLAAGVALAGVALVPVVAQAAHPRHGGHYAGIGTVCENNTGHGWACLDPRRGPGFHEAFSLDVSGRTLTFRGHIDAYCNFQNQVLTVSALPVRSSGVFSFRVRRPEPMAGGGFVPNQYIYSSLNGKFTGTGKTVNVSYLIDIGAPAHPKYNPYSPAFPQRLACAAWVHGAARTP